MTQPDRKTRSVSHPLKVTRRAARTLLLASLLAASPLTSAHTAGRVFYDGFEDGTTNKWGVPNLTNRCPVVTSSLDGIAGPHGGTKMLRCNWDGTRPGSDPASLEGLKLSSWTYGKEFLLRFWYRQDRDVDVVGGAKLLRLGWGSNNGSYWETVLNQLPPVNLHMYWDTQQNQYGWCCDTFWGSQSSIIGNNNWHKLELYIKHDSGQPDGIIRVWANGTQVYNQVNVISHYAGEYWWPLNVMSNWAANHDANNHVYWDDFEIYSDTGTGATGLMSDASISASGTSPTPTPTPTVLSESPPTCV